MLKNRLILSPQEVETAVARIKSHRPAYRAMLGFYGNLFLAQQKSTPAVEPPPIPEAILAAKRKEALPLIDKTEFQIDHSAAGDLFLTLCDIAVLPEEGLSVDVNPLKQAVLSGDIVMEELFSAFLRDNPAPIADAAGKSGLKQPLLEFLVYNSIKPSLTAYREKLVLHLEPNDEWDKGYCPVCGGLPVLSSLSAESGQRRLFCAVCWHGWAFPRMRCPHCSHDAPKGHPYLYAEEEPEYRVDLCDTCRAYTKTVDIRRLDRPFYPPLEALVTLHLDMMAQENGYESGLPMEMEG